jgi:hypothetical protein
MGGNITKSISLVETVKRLKIPEGENAIIIWKLK